MIKRDMVVIGASAGGLAALQVLVRSFQPDLAAAIFVVLHVRPQEPSLLPHVLRTRTLLPVEHARDGETIRTGRVYVAPPDRHLVIESGHLHLSVGPKENRTRPAINPLFRSAALAYGPRVIGVILSGTLDDGTAGLWEIKRRGGVAVAQLPGDAMYEDMPSSAITHVHVDYQVPVTEMGSLLNSLVGGVSEAAGGDVEAVMSEKTRLTCPDCHGPIERLKFGPLTEYKCRVGHTYSPGSMLAAHEDAEERVLWSAIESLEEGADLADELDGNLVQERRFSLRGNAKAKRSLAKAIRRAVETAKVEPPD